MSDVQKLKRAVLQIEKGEDLEQSIQFRDIQRMLPSGHHVGKEMKNAFDVLDSENQFLYREEWDEKFTLKLQQQTGIPIIVSNAKRAHLWHRFTYRTSGDPRMIVSFCLIHNLMRKNFHLVIWVHKNQDNVGVQLDYSDLSKEQQQEWTSLVKEAEALLVEDNRYRLLAATGELHTSYA